MSKKIDAQKQDALEYLLKMLPPGSTAYTVQRHLSRSGMHRLIDVYAIQDGEPQWLTGYVARVTGFKLDKEREALRVGGCGMDMGFHVVYELSHRLYPKGFGCIGREESYRWHCPSNDHANGDRDYTPHGVCKDCCEDSHAPTPGHEYLHWHRDGGYAVRQRWM